MMTDTTTQRPATPAPVEQETLTLRVLRHLDSLGPDARVLARDVAEALGEYTPAPPGTRRSDGDVHPVRQVMNRLSRASFADAMGYGPVERYDKMGPYTVYRVTERVGDFLRERDR